FFNLRSELYDALRARFEEQTIVIPNDDDLIGQLAAIRVEYTSRGQLKIEPKETMRRRSLPSPDKADALLLAFAPTPPENPYRVWT
ncbi:MAG: terminase B, partial [Chloroflexi bacterium]|nr:terminase B [Chloroflexota bacterium]